MVPISFEPNIYVLFGSMSFVMWLRVITSLFHCRTFYVFGLMTLSVAKIVYSR